MNKEILIGFVQGRIGLREKREKKKIHDCPKVRDRRVGSKVVGPPTKGLPAMAGSIYIFFNFK